MNENRPDYSQKAKTIFRTIKNEDHPFVMIDRRPVENPDLSWGAKGVLSYLLSRPDNWTVRLRDLVNRSTDGVYKIRGYIRELNKAGHLLRKAERDPITKRIIQYTLEVYELPFTTKPLTNLPQAGLPQAGNLTLNDTDSLNDTDLYNSGKPPLSDKELEEVNQMVDGILGSSNGQHWQGRETFRPDHLPLVDWYHRVTGQDCPKSKRKDWHKAVILWAANNLTAEDLQAAYDKDIQWRGVFTSPNQLTDKAIAIRAQKRVKTEPAEETRPEYLPFPFLDEQA